jgi:undecaprenyl-diphosphatase
LLASIRRRYSTLVRRVPDERARRRPGDAVRVVVAAIILTLLALHANDPSAAERALARFFRLLPDDAESFILAFYDLLALWALVLVAFALILVRRWRLARDVAAAGSLAWLLGRLISAFVEKTDLAHAFSVTFDLSDVPRFPLVRVSMAVAVITVASPYLARPTRRVGQAIVFLLAIATMYIGRSRPADILGAIVLGWGVAALVHFVFGTAARRPTPEQVERALADLDVPVDRVRAADEQPVARAIFSVDSPSGPLRVIAIGRDEADAQLLARIWRWIAYRDAPPTLFPTRR